MAVVALGYGITKYLSRPSQNYSFDAAEEERIRKNKQLMDSYGDKDNLQDIERALAWYELQ
ncbi:hypothetical protein FE257_009442 [Aspergillus nanangensis]|uniref:Uncharacterized protein n=1 Tax=Aspergillus nanangensis TaxID=2582783 RepID=A0AAD4GST3_ASPNN|nr:hypothetical protein FE257_009442 [Aspergillus nanangensis]